MSYYENLYGSNNDLRGKSKHNKLVKLDVSGFDSYEQWLSGQSPYQEIIRDADSDKVKYSANVKIFVGDKSVYGMNTGYKKRYDYLYWRVKPNQNDLGINFDKEGLGYDKEKIDFYAKKRVYESEPDWNDDSFRAKSISADEVRKICDKFYSQYESLYLLQKNIRSLKDEIGNKKINIDNKGYDIVIDYLNERFETCLALMYSMNKAIYNRAPFLQEFQVRIKRDYKRYHGTEICVSRGSYTSSGRENDGWA